MDFKFKKAGRLICTKDPEPCFVTKGILQWGYENQEVEPASENGKESLKWLENQKRVLDCRIIQTVYDSLGGYPGGKRHIQIYSNKFVKPGHFIRAGSVLCMIVEVAVIDRLYFIDVLPVRVNEAIPFIPRYTQIVIEGSADYSNYGGNEVHVFSEDLIEKVSKGNNVSPEDVINRYLRSGIMLRDITKP